ncbi:hypothetical protein Q428_11160 [Fervidicella metallireducens AeB]|uniref:Uncharacterized protein n=1 Tax=Fervidicella metallireducens AeB TaxID=1403537 RepID=A0A017RVC4_9CLOT|nr:hypothetical protein Q428_11160 [Fervidicella metallireducens AeB]
MLEKFGVPTQSDIERILPTKERLKRAPLQYLNVFKRYRVIHAKQHVLKEL